MAERACDALAMGVMFPAAALGLAAAETLRGTTPSGGCWGEALGEDDARSAVADASRVKEDFKQDLHSQTLPR